MPCLQRPGRGLLHLTNLNTLPKTLHQDGCSNKANTPTLPHEESTSSGLVPEALPRQSPNCLSRHPSSPQAYKKAGSREAQFSSPAPGKRRASEGRARAPARRRPGVPRAWRAPGRAEEFPGGRGGGGGAGSPQEVPTPEAAAPHLPGSGCEEPRQRRLRQRLGAVRPGPPAPALAPAPAPAPAAGAAHWLPRYGTASASANQRRAAPFGNFFPRARARRGHAAALGGLAGGALGGSRCWAGFWPALEAKVCSLDTGGTGWDLRATHFKKI